MKTPALDIEFKDIVEAARDVIVVTKADPIDLPGPEIVYVNPAFTQQTGYTAEEVIGKTPRMLQTSETSQETRYHIRQALVEKRSVRATVKNKGKDGTGYWLEINIRPLKNKEGLVTHFVSIERDVTEQKLLEEKLEKLSRTDDLTGSYNRRAFFEALKQEFSRFQRSKIGYALLSFDLDFFKKINDHYGHPTGDVVLKKVADICHNLFRTQDTFARVGGEEFSIILPSTAASGACTIANRLRNAIENSIIKTEVGEIKVTISAGISEVSASDESAEAVIARADKALYKAKDMGRNCVVVDVE